MNKILAYHNVWELFNGKRKDIIYYKTAPAYIIQMFITNDFDIRQSDTQPPAAVLIKGWGKDWPTEEECATLIKEMNYILPDCDIVHYIGNTKKSIYRRHKLNEYLKQKYTVSTIRLGVAPMSEGQVLVISDPRGSDALVAEAIKHSCKIVYDRTDNWRGLPESPFCEDEILEKASVVICSSKWLYDDLDGEHSNKVVLIESGADEFEWKETEKRDIAVYVGSAEGKVDEEYCSMLKEEHPDFQFVSIGYDIPGFMNYKFMDKDLMMKYLSKCKVGLIPLKDDAYRAGQFNLKIWDYIQAHLAVVTTNDYNYKWSKNVSTEWHTDFTEEPIVYWDEVFKKMENIIHAE